MNKKKIVKSILGSRIGQIIAIVVLLTGLVLVGTTLLIGYKATTFLTNDNFSQTIELAEKVKVNYLTPLLESADTQKIKDGLECLSLLTGESPQALLESVKPNLENIDQMTENFDKAKSALESVPEKAIENTSAMWSCLKSLM